MATRKLTKVHMIANNPNPLFRSDKAASHMGFNILEQLVNKVALQYDVSPLAVMDAMRNADTSALKASVLSLLDSAVAMVRQEIK